MKRILCLSVCLNLAIGLLYGAKATQFTQHFSIVHKRPSPYVYYWVVSDACFAVFNPNSQSNRIQVTITADNPNFQFGGLYGQGDTGSCDFPTITTQPWSNCITNDATYGYLAYPMFGCVFDGPNDSEGSWEMGFTLTATSLDNRPFYLYGPEDGFNAGSTGSTPQNAYHNAWEVFDRYIPVQWDSDISRWVVPWINFWHNAGNQGWPEGWQTKVTVSNSSGASRDYKIYNYGYGTSAGGGNHGHSTQPSDDCQCYSHTNPGNLCAEDHFYQTICKQFTVTNGGNATEDAFRFHVDNEYAWAMMDGQMALSVSGSSPTGSTVTVRVYPNTTGGECE